MSKRPGRNDPCQCGSGKKYKRCCLPGDEAAARERARQQGLFADDFSRGYDFSFGRTFAALGGRRSVERSMSTRLCEALPQIGERFQYEYDFGSTTRLELSVVGERSGRIGRGPARLLARNMAPVWPCAFCGQPASIVCAYCYQVGPDAFVCKYHRRQHGCDEDEGLMPLVNSPRTGICGYTGDS